MTANPTLLIPNVPGDTGAAVDMRPYDTRQGTLTVHGLPQAEQVRLLASGDGINWAPVFDVTGSGKRALPDERYAYLAIQRVTGTTAAGAEVAVGVDSSVGGSMIGLGELATDESNATTTAAELLSVNVVVPTSGRLLVQADIGFSVNGGAVGPAEFQIYVDGVATSLASPRQPPDLTTEDSVCIIGHIGGLTPGAAVIVAIFFRVLQADLTVFVDASSNAPKEHARLIIQAP